MTFPGLAILITVLAINLIGDGLRDALDPEAEEELMMPLLEIRNLSVELRDRAAACSSAVDGVDLDGRARARSLAIVGESGSGKSVAMLAVMGLLPSTAHGHRRPPAPSTARDLLALSAAPSGGRSSARTWR